MSYPIIRKSCGKALLCCKFHSAYNDRSPGFTQFLVGEWYHDFRSASSLKINVGLWLELVTPISIVDRVWMRLLTRPFNLLFLFIFCLFCLFRSGMEPKNKSMLAVWLSLWFSFAIFSKHPSGDLHLSVDISWIFQNKHNINRGNLEISKL